VRFLCLDTNILYHPVLRRLPPSERWVFLALLLLSGEEGKLVYGDMALGEQDFADQAGVSLEETSRALERFLELGLIERQDGILLLSPDWRFQSSFNSLSPQEGKTRRVSTERVRRYRHKVRLEKENFPEEVETLDETQNETPCNALDETLETHDVTRFMKRNETRNETPNETRNETPNETRNETLGEAPFRFQEAKVGAQYAKLGAQFQQILKQVAFLHEEENEQKEKEERSKEEREGEFLSPEGKNTLFSPEREKKKECREGGKEKTPLLSEAFSSFALPHRVEGGPSPGYSSREGNGQQEIEPALPPGRKGTVEGDPPLPPERCKILKDEPAQIEGEASALAPEKKGAPEVIVARRRKRAGNAPSQGPPLLKEGKQEPFSYPKDFEAFWSAYPRRIEKRRAFRAWQARLREGTAPETLISCARNYAEYVLLKDTAECYIKHPATFLGPDRPFEDWREKRVDKTTIPKWSRAAQACIALAEKYEREEENGREDLNLLSL